MIYGFTGLVYAMSYILMLLGIISSREPEEPGGQAATLALMALVARETPVWLLLALGDLSSTIIAGLITIIHQGAIEGRIGYGLLALSHAIRFAALATQNLILLIIAEAVRPVALCLIALRIRG